MLARLRSRRPSHTTIVAYLALFIAVGGGTAFAVVGANQVNSASIIDGQVKNADIGANQIGPGKIVDNSLTGTDINASTLGTVPSATNATNASNLGGKPPSAFAAASTFRRSALNVNDPTANNTAVTQSLLTTPSLKVVASCNNAGGGALTGKILVSNPSTGWSVDSSGGPGGVNNKTNLPAGEQVIATFGPTTFRQMATASYSASISAIRIDGVVSLELHPNGGATLCAFSHGSFVTQP
jgi:hypothetical protein